VLLQDIGPVLQKVWIVCRTTYEAPPHASEIIRCGKPALFGRVGYDPIVANISHFDEAWRGANSSKDTLIVSCLSFKKFLKLVFSILTRLGLYKKLNMRKRVSQQEKERKILLSCMPLAFENESRRRDEVN
jgi:hypothetical protein